VEVKKSITHGIAIAVRCKFLDKSNGQYCYSYEISMHNTSNKVVQLTHRHWDIFDSIGGDRIVEGEGVVGEKPVLQPGEYYKYSSMCTLLSTFGTMSGYYKFICFEDKKIMRVKIPKFELVFPGTLN